MTARQPRRTRRRDLPAESLPRLRPEEERERRRLLRTASGSSTERRPVAEHHVATDYQYVHSDLKMITVVSVVTLAFVVGMSFVL